MEHSLTSANLLQASIVSLIQDFVLAADVSATQANDLYLRNKLFQYCPDVTIVIGKQTWVEEKGTSKL